MAKNIPLLLMSIIFAAGCASTPPGEPRPDDNITSVVLRRVYARALAEFAEEAKTKGGDPNRDAIQPQDIAASIEQLDRRFPSVFKVTVRQEEAFKRGNFNDIANLQTVRQSMEYLRRHGGKQALPIVSLVLLRKMHEGDLEGAELELAARLLSAQAKQIRAGKAGPLE